MIYLGLDVGSVSVKLAGVVDASDMAELKGLERNHAATFTTKEVFIARPSGPVKKLLFLSHYRRIKGEPARAASDLLLEVLEFIPRERLGGLRTTGSGGRAIAEILNVVHENDFRAIAHGVCRLYPSVQTIFEIGGDSSKYIRVEVVGKEQTIGIGDYQKNGDCAAGTGSFMDQQASRLRFNVEEIGDLVISAETAPSIAGRCSVFAKSDMIHAQQKGHSPAQILKGLCEAVVRNFKGSVVKGRKVIAPVAFIGGVAANKGVVQAIRNVFHLTESDLQTPEEYAWMGAIGAACLEAEAKMHRTVGPLSVLDSETRAMESELPRTEPLSMENVVLLRDREKHFSFEGKSLPVASYLGIDVGSVSTNLVLIDEEGNVIKEIYIRTESRPIEVVQRGLREIEEELRDRIVIRGVGTTGSGRELIGVLTGADTINDEITAHKTGAEYVAQRLIGKPVDTIFEIGGQDSKFIQIEDGVVVDFAMNEACAAGTGSFLEEQAERLGIKIQEEFSAMALSSSHPVRLGERCTVFMEKELVPYMQRGASKEDLVAGLANSIALNYLNRVVRGRKIGQSIFFQGGTAYNDSVAAAFATQLKKPIIVPPHNGVIGAIGMALLAKEKIQQTGKTSGFRGFDLQKVQYGLRTFTCKACSNNCDIQEFKVEGQKTYWGDKCSEQYRKQARVDRKPVLADLWIQREQLLLQHYEGSRNGGPVVGIPRHMYFYDRFPFYLEFFREMGFDVLISQPTNKQVVAAGIDTTVAEPCFPIKIAHGHFADLVQQQVDYIFTPNLINGETNFPQMNSHMCPWGQTLPFILGHASAFYDQRQKILSPTIHFREKPEIVEQEFVAYFRERLRKSERTIRNAVRRGYEGQRLFQTQVQEAGQEALETLKKSGQPAIVMVGRSYNLNDRGVNLNIPGKIRDYYGVNVLPMDFLPLDNIDITDIHDNMFWNYGRKILQAARFVEHHPHLHIIYITNFKCGPDSYIHHFMNLACAKPYLTLQFDGHSNDAGMMTRCEAYLDSKGFLRNWK